MVLKHMKDCLPGYPDFWQRILEILVNCYHNDIFDRDRSITEQMVRRAENSGFTALVLTVDTPTFGNRYADTRNKFSLPSHLK